ncbi:endo-1,3-alpha-glucanase family glycosylhydrolase [Bradyrhizobium sp. CB82]|uniref:endo-1,3-alpha-glucanase family glycosylhydrolase n=1 Tax=Bradyrhizobium sp. CB82 TaxID=3039159 RepID=UPI0024B2107B|nr:endo-1,3-alpha-glucanase family glycosylhydrolase [Bradyrhizobium sp. CB82]WFU39433.1 endo-1,3-alpha-glucanase family glycosylhydrolase [Bradyrhizobium sp. CB82]
MLSTVGRLLFATVSAWIALSQTSCAEDRLSLPKMVFAHYMVCCPTNGLGATVEDFEHEIAIARTYGLDGFALNVPGWSREPHYLDISRRMFAAAERSAPSFKLFLSFDDAPVSDSATMLIELSASPAYLQVEGRPVVSTYSGTPEWGAALRERLSSSGVRPFLVPNYQYLTDRVWSRNYSRPTAQFLDSLFRGHPDINGYFVFGPDLGYAKPPTDGPLVAARSKFAGKLSMIGISPYYRGLRGNFRVFESGGFEGMATQWTAAIESGADWIEIVTWNDWGESTYVAPYGDIRRQDLWNYHWGPLLSHEAFLKASRYYIDWFKSSRRPRIDHPSIYYFYRLHPKSAYGIASPDTNEQGRPKGWEDLVDCICVTTFLPRPLTVDVTVGGHRRSATMPAGVHHYAFEMSEGPIVMTIIDQGRSIAEKQLEFPITNTGQTGNFNYFAGEIPLP